MRPTRKPRVWKIIKKIIFAIIVLYAASVLMQVVFAPGFEPENLLSDTINVIKENSSDDGEAFDKTETICEIRDAMLNREPEIEISFREKEVDYVHNDEEFFADFIEPATSEEYATGCYSGDYLDNVVDKYSYTISKAGNLYTATIRLKYKDSLAQEAELDAAVRQAADALGLAGMNEQDRVRAIYKYITTNVEYDHAALELDDDDTSLGGAYTAYSAMIKGKAVCQGYACLFYVMCKNAGIDARIVSGKSNNGSRIGNHAWNMVCVDGVWYYADATWDSKKNGNWEYYLVSAEEIGKDHFQED